MKIAIIAASVALGVPCAGVAAQDASREGAVDPTPQAAADRLYFDARWSAPCIALR